MIPQTPPITTPALPPLAPPAYVQKYNQIRKALGMPPSEGSVYQRTQVERFAQQVILSDNPKKGWGFQVTLDQNTGTLVTIDSNLDLETLSKKYKENPGPLISRQDTESILNSLLSFTLLEQDRKSWEIVNYSMSQNEGNDPYYFPTSYFYLRRLVDSIPVIKASIFLHVDSQRAQVHSYKYEERIIIPQTIPLIPEPLARAIAQKTFLEAGGSPEARCRLVWDRVAWWPIRDPFNRLAYRYEFELRQEGMPEDKEGVVWSVPIDAQTGTVWWLRIETGGGGSNIPNVTPKSYPYFQRFSFAADSLDAQKFSIAALSINKPEPATAPEKFSCLVTTRHKVYYSWDPKLSRLAFTVDNTKDWIGGVVPEKTAMPFVEWLKTQHATPAEQEPAPKK